jgi:hypothetical protein
MQMSQTILRYFENDVAIIVSRDDEKNAFTFTINNGQDGLKFQSIPTFIPHIAHLDANGYLKFINACQRLGTPSTLTLELGNEMKPSEAHYTLNIPDPFMGRDVMVYINHFVPLNNDECVQIVAERLNKKIAEKNEVIKAQAQKIADLDTKLDDLVKQMNQLDKLVTTMNARSDSAKKSSGSITTFKPSFANPN